MASLGNKSVGGDAAALARLPIVLPLRFLALAGTVLGFVFSASSFLVFTRGWPTLYTFFAHLGWFGVEPLDAPLDGATATLGWLHLALYILPVAAVATYVAMRRSRTLVADSQVLTDIAAYIVRAAFWGVLLIGVADAVISFLRVEDLLASVVGEVLARDLGRSSFRGNNVHYPLIAVSMVIAYFHRTIGFIWLALLIVGAEMAIVISRFIFSYEQAFMADLVRFWYGAMFLFASAYTLVHEGHVRVDILYAGFSDRGKAWTNLVGALAFGIPLCWVVLTMGLWSSSNIIAGPILSYEVTQQGFGLYVKYFMAGFLLIYALTMLMQFSSYFLKSLAVLVDEPGATSTTGEKPAEI